jgi:hypothetical protein
MSWVKVKGEFAALRLRTCEFKDKSIRLAMSRNKTKEQTYLRKWICFKSWKIISVQATRFQSFNISEGTRKSILDFKFQKLKNFLEGKKQGQLQQYHLVPLITFYTLTYSLRKLVSK